MILLDICLEVAVKDPDWSEPK